MCYVSVFIFAALYVCCVIVEEGFFSQNWLYIGKCYYSLKKKDEAKVWLKKAAQVQGDNQDDSEVGYTK